MTQANSKKLSLNTQYIKDLSFENPNAPASLAKIANKPKIDFNIDVKARKLNETTYEIVLNITTKAGDSEEKDFVIFLAELKYAGIFTIEEKDEDEIKRILLVDCTTLLFPFARRVLADATRDGGFPPLIMDPIDFNAFFEKNGANADVATVQ